MKIWTRMKSRFAKNLKNQKGQGMTEYILLLVLVVGLVMMFKGQITDIIKEKVGALSSDIQGFDAN